VWKMQLNPMKVSMSMVRGSLNKLKSLKLCGRHDQGFCLQCWWSQEQVCHHAVAEQDNVWKRQRTQRPNESLSEHGERFLEQVEVIETVWGKFVPPCHENDNAKDKECAPC